MRAGLRSFSAGRRLLVVGVVCTAMAGCGPRLSDDAFATQVIATVIAGETQAAMPSAKACDSMMDPGELRPITEFNAPGLRKIGTLGGFRYSISLNPTGSCMAAADRIGASIIEVRPMRDVLRYLKYQDAPLQALH